MCLPPLDEDHRDQREERTADAPRVIPSYAGTPKVLHEVGSEMEVKQL